MRGTYTALTFFVMRGTYTTLLPTGIEIGEISFIVIAGTLTCIKLI